MESNMFDDDLFIVDDNEFEFVTSPLDKVEIVIDDITIVVDLKEDK